MCNMEKNIFVQNDESHKSAARLRACAPVGAPSFRFLAPIGILSAQSSNSQVAQKFLKTLFILLLTNGCKICYTLGVPSKQKRNEVVKNEVRCMDEFRIRKT